MCPDRKCDQVRAKKLLRALTTGMLLMWDRGLHSYPMVNATLPQGCDYLERIPKNVKFSPEKVLDDRSYLSLIAPDGKSQKKSCGKIQVRVVDPTIDEASTPQTYRLITSLMDVVLFPALLLAAEYHQRSRALKIKLTNSNPVKLFKKFSGLLLGHYAVRCLMFQAAQQVEISQLRLGFTGTLRVIPRAISDFQDI